MKRTEKTRVQDTLRRLLLLSCLGLACWLAGMGTGQAQGLSRRPLPKLDTKRGLYIKRDGTRLYKDPAPPKNRVFSYRRRDGRVVQTLAGPRRPYASGAKRGASKRSAKRSSNRKKAPRRTSRRR